MTGPSHRLSTHQPHYLQVWVLLISLVLFGLYVVNDLNYLSLIIALDRSFMASLTFALLLLATAHCGWHIAYMTRHIGQLQDWLDQPPATAEHSSSFLRSWLHELDDALPASAAQAMDNPTNTPIDSPTYSLIDNLVDIHAERLRSAVDLGWFFVDLAVRFGLLGTIIGFILIFASLTDINIEGGDDLKALLIAMSGGMGTALLTTLTGLVTASLLSLQYLILGRASEHLAGLLLRVSHRYKGYRPARSKGPADLSGNELPTPS